MKSLNAEALPSAHSAENFIAQKHTTMRFCHGNFSWLVEALIVSVSFLVFALLDGLDRLLCAVFWALDSILDSEVTPCYCKRRRHGALPQASRPNDAAHSLDSFHGEGRPSHVKHPHATTHSSSHIAFPIAMIHKEECRAMALECLPSHLNTVNHGRGIERGALISTMSPSQARSKTSGRMVSRWSDCGCFTCTTWQSDDKELLYVHMEHEDQDVSKCSNITNLGHENVVFIHGFLSSSSLWSEKVIPYLPESTKTAYRLYAIDLLGFGKSPKPRNCLYTMADHIKKIEESVLQRYKVDKFHLVAHSMGCIVALALGAAHVDAVKTITLVAPPYFPAPSNESAAAYVLRQVAPRRVWPLIKFGASVMSWYEHVGRGICFLVCKQHSVWEYVVRTVTLNRVSSFSIRNFMQHTHHSAWHIFHNVICGEAHALDGYLSALERRGCEIHVLHGKEDIVVPAQCSLQLQERYHKLKVEVVDGVNHFTIIYGREKMLSHTFDRIWRDASSNADL